jgi:hypothetical protein
MGAIECYFWHVGERWDAEWLVTSRHPLVEQQRSASQEGKAASYEIMMSIGARR